MAPRGARIAGLLISLGACTALGACGGASTSAPASKTSLARRSTTTSTTHLPPAPQVAIAVASWHLPRPSARAVVLADRSGLLVLGGLDGTGNTTPEVLHVDLASGTTSADGTLTAPVHDAAGASLLGAPTVFGGGNVSESNAVQRFVSGRTSTVVGRLPIPRSDLGAVAIGSRAYLVGGYDGSRIRATVLATTDGSKFDLLGDLPVPVRYPAVAAQGNDVLVLGGATSHGDTDAIQQVDTGTGAVRVVGRLAKTLSHAVATTVNGRVYVFGGRWGGVPTAQVWRWDPASATLLPVGNLSTPVTDAAVATVGSTAYLVGGDAPRPTTTVSELRVR